MSPKGLKAPPAFEAITTFTQARQTKRRFSRPVAITTAPINRAVERLSRNGERKKLLNPVSQKSCR